MWEQPIDGELLLLRLRTWVEAKRVVDDAERVSLVDIESGLYTYRGLSRRARELLADAARRKTPVSCIAIGPMVTRANQSTGSELPVPARLAADIGRVVASVARGSDVVGRMGSSEFAILAPMTEMPGAAELVERLRDRVAAMPPLVADGKSSRIALRAGMVTIGDATADLRDASDILVRAATALRYAQSSRAIGVSTFDDVPSTFV